jgi:hypothetical protein
MRPTKSVSRKGFGTGIDGLSGPIVTGVAAVALLLYTGRLPRPAHQRRFDTVVIERLADWASALQLARRSCETRLVVPRAVSNMSAAVRLASTLTAGSNTCSRYSRIASGACGRAAAQPHWKSAHCSQTNALSSSNAAGLISGRSWYQPICAMPRTTVNNGIRAAAASAKGRTAR